MFLEQVDEEEIDNLEGCRKGENMVKHKSTRSGGLIVFMTCIGFILGLKPVLRTESPTFIFQTLCALIYNDSRINEYFSRCIVVFGWDMMCKLMGRLLGKKFRHLLFNEKSEIDEVIKIYYLMVTFGLHRLFIDKMHSNSHKNDECKLSEGIFNVWHEKFKNIFKKKNHNIAEQFWVRINKLKNCKLLHSEKYNIAIYLTMELHNYEIKKRLEKEGITFESITNFKPRLKISWDQALEWYTNLTNWYNKKKQNINKAMYSQFKDIPLNYEDLIKSEIHKKKIATIQRCDIQYTKIKFKNFWIKNERESYFQTNEQLEYLNNELNNVLKQELTKNDGLRNYSNDKINDHLKILIKKQTNLKKIINKYPKWIKDWIRIKTSNLQN